MQFPRFLLSSVRSAPASCMVYFKCNNPPVYKKILSKNTFESSYIYEIMQQANSILFSCGLPWNGCKPNSYWWQTSRNFHPVCLQIKKLICILPIFRTPSCMYMMFIKFCFETIINHIKYLKHRTKNCQAVQGWCCN